MTDAFEELVRRYQSTVLRTCQRYLGNHEDAEEVCQDAFLRVFHGLSRFKGESKFRTWLFRLVTNACTDRYRRQQTLRARQVEYLPETMEPRARDAQVAEEEFGTLDGPVGRALARLKDAEREVLVLRHVAGLSIGELAGAIGLGESAAKMRLYRAEDRLREVYQSGHREPPDVAETDGFV